MKEKMLFCDVAWAGSGLGWAGLARTGLFNTTLRDTGFDLTLETENWTAPSQSGLG